MAEHEQTAREDRTAQPNEISPPTQPSSHPDDLTASQPPSPPAVANPVMVGNSLGPYRLTAMLGQGGMGAVYKAQHEHLDKTVAIKVLPQQITRHPESIARFKREMKAVGKIDHPNIVRAMDAGEVNGTHYLAMEYVEGSDLQQLVRDRGPLPVVAACKAIRQAAQALAAAHGVGLIHRDIKPANLLLTKSGQIKLLDLGLALLGDDGDGHTELTTAGQTFGTPDYMAPEQWENAHAADARTDLYALGCTLYYLLVGHAPYATEKYATGIGKMKAHVIDPIPEFPPTRSDIPAGVIAIYRLLMAKLPDERFQSAAQLADALAPFSSSKSVPVATVVSGTALAADSSAQQPTQVPVARAIPLTDPESPSRQTSDVAATQTPNSHESSNGIPPGDLPTIALDVAPATRPGMGPSRKPDRKLLYAVGGGAFLILCGVIIITITHQNGTQTKIKVPDTSNISITHNPEKTNQTQNTKHKTQNTWHGWPADAPKPAIAPFDAAQAKKHQEEWAAYLKIPVEHTNSIGMKFMLIPPGEFTMGSTAEEIVAALKNAGGDKHVQECIQSEAPQHKVILTQPIYLGVNEVTQAEYEKVMGSNPSHFAPMGMGKAAVAGLETAEHSVESVSWNDAAEFCAKLSKQEKLQPFYFRAGDTITPLGGTGYRLPSEAEWEFACRAGTATKHWIGDKHEDLVRAGWFGGNSGGRTHAAGELNANPFGLSEIHGNVWEWVQDGWDATYYGQFSEKLAVNPNSPFSVGSQRVVRGGSWNSPASHCRSSGRHASAPTVRHDIGFRVSLSVDAVKAALAEQTPPVTSSNLPWHGWPADAPKPAIAPFDAVQAKKHQEEWAAYLKIPVDHTNSIGMKFVLIPPGEFTMGSTAEEISTALKDFPPEDKHWQECIKSEAPQHKVILTQPIYLGVNEVTQAEYEKVMGLNPSHFAPMGMGKEAVAGLETAEHPVETVSWNDAAEFCAKLSMQEKLKPFYFRASETITPLDGTGYRLPSEAEWEFACRAGTATKYWIGEKDEDLVRAGWFGGNSGGRTHAAGELRANPFGLSAIHGNVWEWVQDGWNASYYGQFSEKPAINPNSPFSAGSQRVLRGGSWSYDASRCRSSNRNADAPASRNGGIGFRVSLVAVGSRVGR